MTSFRDRLEYDAEGGEYRDSGIRYMMIRPDALMGILNELEEPCREAFLDAFARSIANHGGKSAEAYRRMGNSDGDSLLATIEQTAPQLGWGRWQLARTQTGLALSVENSPFAQGASPRQRPVCHPIVGMLRAVGRLVLGGDVEVRETECASCGGTLCRFEVRCLP